MATENPLVEALRSHIEDARISGRRAPTPQLRRAHAEVECRLAEWLAEIDDGARDEPEAPRVVESPAA